MEEQPLCSRFLLPHTALTNLAKGKVTYEGTGESQTHPRLKSRQVKAQDRFLRTLAIQVIQQSTTCTSPIFPFLYITPNAIALDYDKQPILVYIEKVCEGSTAALTLHSDNVWKKAEETAGLLSFSSTIVYAVEEVDKPRNYYSGLGQRQPTATRKMLKNKDKVIKGYVKYLESYFSCVYSIEMSASTTTKIESLLQDHLARAEKSLYHKSLNDVMKFLDQRTVITTG